MAGFTCVVLDDDPDWADLVRRAVKRPGLSLTIRPFTDVEDALESLRQESVDLVITDLRMPKCNGLTFTRRFRQFEPSTPVIVISSDGVTAAEVADCGANAFVSKRTLNTRLAGVVREVLGPKNDPVDGDGAANRDRTRRAKRT